MKSFKFLFGDNTIRGAAGILAVTMTLSNILGLARNSILAKNISFDSLDTYYAAFRIPDLIFNVLILGALSTAFIPVFTDLKKNEGRWELVNSLINLIFLGLIILGIILFFVMPTIIPLIVPGFSALRVEHTVSFARILLLSPLFFGFSYIFAGVLQSYKRFMVYSLAPIVYNISIILGAVFAPRYGITGVIWATIGGAFLHMIIQWIAVRNLSFKYKFYLDLKNKALIKIGRLMIPRSISLTLAQVNIIAFTILGSRLKEGAIAIYSLTNDFQTAPTVILTSSIATAIFPHLAENYNKNKKTEFNALLFKTIRMTTFLLLPATIMIWVLRAQIIRLYIALGNQVTWDDTIRAIDTLGFFTISILFQGLIIILSRAYYARHDAKRPMYFSLSNMLVSIVLAYWFSAHTKLDVAGLALAFSIGSFVNALLLALPFLSGARLSFVRLFHSGFFKILLSTLATGFFSWLTLQIIGDGLRIDGISIVGMGTSTVNGLAVQLIGASSIGLIVYYILTRALRCPEIDWIIIRSEKNIMKN